MSLAKGLLVITTYERMGQTKDDGKRYREERTGKGRDPAALPLLNRERE